MAIIGRASFGNKDKFVLESRDSRSSIKHCPIHPNDKSSMKWQHRLICTAQ